MKNTIDPKKAIAVICAVSVFIVGGCILGRHIIGGEEDSEVAAVTSPSPSASPSSAHGYSIDTAYDGIVGKETASPVPSSVQETPQSSPAAETKAPALRPERKAAAPVLRLQAAPIAERRASHPKRLGVLTKARAIVPVAQRRLEVVPTVAAKFMYLASGGLLLLLVVIRKQNLKAMATGTNKLEQWDNSILNTKARLILPCFFFWRLR